MNQEPCTQRQADAAAKWWREHVGTPALDAGDMGEHAVIGTLMARTAQRSCSETQLIQFENSMRALITGPCSADIRRGGLHVDYGPDRYLDMVLNICGINSPNSLPWKTHMWFGDDGSLKVRCGYRAETVEILAPDVATGGGAIDATVRH